MDALHRAGLQPFDFDDLESVCLDEGELAAGEVLAGRTDGDPFEEPLGGVERRPGAADVVQQQQSAARDQDAFHLADRCGGVGDRAQRQRADHRVERRVAEGQVFGVALLEVDAEHLPFADASFDTVVCALSLCTIPHPAMAIGEMKRVLVPGGRLLLLDHIASTWPPVYAAQWLLERVTICAAGEHFTRRQLPLVRAAGFHVVETERLKAGTVERIHAVKPA